MLKLTVVTLYIIIWLVMLVVASQPSLRFIVTTGNRHTQSKYQPGSGGESRGGNGPPIFKPKPRPFRISFRRGTSTGQDRHTVPFSKPEPNFENFESASVGMIRSTYTVWIEAEFSHFFNQLRSMIFHYKFVMLRYNQLQKMKVLIVVITIAIVAVHVEAATWLSK